MEYKGKICKGSWSFGNNCKTCEKCVDTNPFVNKPTEDSVKQMPSNVQFDVEFRGYNFHMTFSFDCKELYEVDDATVNSDFGEKYPATSEERVEFMESMERFVRDKMWTDKSIWS